MDEMMALIVTVLRASSHRIVGRLGADPQIRYLESGRQVASVRIAVNVPGAKQGDGKEPDWFTVELWGEAAQGFADGAHKGDLIEVIGRVRTNRWTDRSGAARVDLIVNADHWSMVRPAAAPQAAPAAPSQAPRQAAPAAPVPQAAPAAPAPAWHGDPPF